MKAIDQHDANVGEVAHRRPHHPRRGLPSTRTSESGESRDRAVENEDDEKIPPSGPSSSRRSAPCRPSSRSTSSSRRSRPRNADLISKDGHAAFIPFRPEGDYDAASLYIDNIVASIAEVARANPDLLRRAPSVRAPTRRSTRCSGRHARAGGPDRDPVDVRHAAARLPIARGGARTAPARPDVGDRDDRASSTLPSLAIPMSQEDDGGRSSSSASRSASTTRSSTSSASVKSGSPGAANRQRSRPPRPPRDVRCSSPA